MAAFEQRPDVGELGSRLEEGDPWHKDPEGWEQQGGRNRGARRTRVSAGGGGGGGQVTRGGGRCSPHVGLAFVLRWESAGDREHRRDVI